MVIIPKGVEEHRDGFDEMFWTERSRCCYLRLETLHRGYRLEPAVQYALLEGTE